MYGSSIQWLIQALAKADRLFKVYNLGAGVSRITTETDVCPCCKRKASNEEENKAPKV